MPARPQPAARRWRGPRRGAPPGPPARAPAGARLRAAALWLVLVLMPALGPAPAVAQQAAQIAADSLRLEAGGRLVAEGRVEILHRGARLRATRLVYDRGSGGAPDRLEVAGPIVLEDGARVLILADAAEMSPDLRAGVLRGARLVLDRRLQFAAASVARTPDRITRLERVAASTCQVCADDPTPLWEIRAARVTHDAEARTLEFERAAFRIAGRTVAVLPRLRMPDPTARRARGWLAPEVGGGSALGPGVEVPYFLPLGPHRDLTLRPRFHVRGSYTLGARYRQALARGRFEIDAALTRDRLRPGNWRGQITAEGQYALVPGTALGGALHLASDPAYRTDYGLDQDEIRTNTLFLEHVRRDRLGRVRLTQFRSLRGGDDNTRLPNRVLEAGLARRLSPPGLGGTAWVRLDALAAARASNDPAAGAGRDLARLTLRADWRRDWLLPGGVQTAALAAVQADHWRIRRDDRFAPRIDRLHPSAALELRWPLLRTDPGGARHLLEPVVQLVWAPGAPDPTPDEDSRLQELDEITLFRLQRGPGLDRLEGGTRANIGLSWTRHDPAGWSLRAQAGRVLRDRNAPADGLSGPLSGLGTGRGSDWLAALRLDLPMGLALAGRAVIDSDGRNPREELRLGWSGETAQLGGSYLQLAADPAQARAARTAEIALNGAVALDGRWTALADLRYDLARDEPGHASIGARFRNECLAVDLSLSRRFVSSTNVAARTDFGLRVELIGFGDRPGGPARRCGG